MAYHRTARSEEVREASRTAILAAARRLFATHGYDATTMQDIVAAAGTSIGNAYFYFGSKSQLLHELLDSAATDVWTRTTGAVASTPPGSARIAATIYMNINAVLESEHDLTQLLLSREHGANALALVEERTISQWTTILAEHMPSLPARDRVRAGTMIWGANMTLVDRVMAGTITITPTAAAEHCARWALRGLRVPEKEIDAAVRAAVKCASLAKKGKGKDGRRVHLAT